MLKAVRAPNMGFTLIEVLVTAIVMAVGLLGLAGLQMAAMKSNHSAYQRTLAVLAAYDLIDRFRMAPARKEHAHFKALHNKDESNSVEGQAVFTAWANDLRSGPLGINPIEEEPIGELDCSENDTTNICDKGNCRITIRWNDSRPETAFGITVKQTEDDKRKPELLELTICTRLPEAI